MQMMKLRPWTEIVKLHPDVESGQTAMAAYAIDLGALVDNDPNVPVAYRDAESFFRITYPTEGMRRLLAEVLGRLTGQGGDRVLQLRSPFGGGKSHSLAALYHAARSRAALAQLGECTDLPDPGVVRVAVFDGEKFDALTGKEVDGPASAEASAGKQRIRTMWGWLAWQLGEDAFALVRQHDEQKVSPGGDVIAKLLGDQPTLLLLDEVLKYLEKAAGDRVVDSTHERQAKDFLQSLSVEVARSSKAVMVYSLQASAKEALGNVALLQELDHLTSRVDAKCEPVTGDEVMAVLHRRLLRESPDEQVAATVADAVAAVVTQMRAAYAATDEDKRLAEEEGIQFRERIKRSYPFHPALIDVMKERWNSIPDFQRTRGALRFLAVCMHALKTRGGAQVMLGPGDIPLHDGDVRQAFFTEVGQREVYQAVLDSDLVGRNARVWPIDRRMEKQEPALAGVKPAQRLATAALMYSFGGLMRPGSETGELLPPGATQEELFACSVGPDLDSITAQACLKELRDIRGCLYLHYDGVRYCFKTTPNVNMLVEGEAEAVDRERGAVEAAIRERLEHELGGEQNALIWPARSDQIPDEQPAFLVAYLPIEFAHKSKAEREKSAKEMLEKYGDKPRRYRNALGLAIPDRSQITPLQRSVRYLLAIDRVSAKKSQYQLTKPQQDELAERRRTEEGGITSAFRALYSAVWLPKVENGSITLDPMEIGGRPLQATGIHARVMELLTSGPSRRVFGSLEPRRIVDRMKLGEAAGGQESSRLGVAVKDVQDAFFGILGFTRLTDRSALSRAVASGVKDGMFGYTGRGAPELGADGRYTIAHDRVVFEEVLSEDEVDFDDGFLMLPQALPAEAVVEAPGPEPPAPPGPGPVPPGPGPIPEKQMTVRISFRANRQQLYAAWNALANLADAAGTVHVTVEAHKEEGFDQVWLRNAVTEPVEESGAEVDG